MNNARLPGRLLWLLGLRQMRARPGRALLTMFSVVIGVAGVVSVTTATNATHHAYHDMYAAMSGRAAMEIVSERGGTCPQSLVEEIEQVPGVQTAAPTVQRASSLYVGEKRVDAVILGVDPQRNHALRDFQLKSGASLEDEDGAVLDASFAASAGVKVGDEIKVFTRSGMRRLPVTGMLAPLSVASARQGGTVWVRLDRAQTLFRLDDRIDTIQVLLKDGVEEEAAEHKVQPLLPPGVIIRHPQARSRQVHDRMLSAQLGLNVGCAYTLLAAAFIILNTMVMNVTERRRQLGILRAVGATRRQVTSLLICEGAILGVAGTLLGLGIGVLGASALTRTMERLFGAPLPALDISTMSLGLGSLAGIGISLLATFIPARRAALIPPVEAMRRGPGVSLTRGGWLVSALGGLLMASGLSVTMLSLAGRVRPSLVIPSGLAMLIALILLIPTVLRPMLRLMAAIVVRVVGIEGRIAQGQLLRWRVRTALTIGVVFVALSTGIGLGNSILANVEDVRDWYRQTLAADFFVRAMHPNMVTGTAAEMPDSIRNKVEGISGITQIDALRFVRSTANDEQILIVARELAQYPELPLDIKEGDPAQIADALKRGETVLGTVLANRLKLHPGDFIEVGTDQGPRRLRVAGVATDYNVGGVMLYMERSAASQIIQFTGADVLLVRCNEEAREHVHAALADLCREEGLILQSFADVGELIDRIMGGVEAGLWAVLSLQFIVAGFGIANTLTMNVLEQTREIGLLRVVAMTRGQVRKMIFTQAGLIGLVAVSLGVPGGVMVGWILNICTRPLTGQPIAFVLHPWLFVGGPLMSLLIVVAAAWFPAERAVRLEPGEALAYE